MKDKLEMVSLVLQHYSGTTNWQDNGPVMKMWLLRVVEGDPDVVRPMLDAFLSAKNKKLVKSTL